MEDIDKRSNNEFPSRWASLPKIGSDSPTPTYHNQIMPYGGGGGAGDASLHELDSRLKNTERSNRALLEEVVRLQGEMKQQLKKNDEIIRIERNARRELETALRSSADIIGNLGSRLQRSEDKNHEDHTALVALMSHVRGLEQSVLGNQQEMLSRKDSQSKRLHDIQNELSEATRAKEQTERVVFQLVDELRQMKARVDTQATDFSAVLNDLKSKNRRLEDDNRQMMLDTMRKQGESQTQSEMNSSQIRHLMEQRLSELRDVIVELRQKQDQDSQERRNLEQQTTLRLGDLESQLGEHARRRDEAMHNMENKQREKDHMSDTDKLRWQAKLAEASEEMNKRLMQKDQKLREELQTRYQKLEEALLEEQENRLKHERDARDALEESLARFQAMMNQSIDGQQEHSKIDLESDMMDKKKNNETLRKLNDAVNLLERSFEEQRKHQDKVIAAEIKSRQQAEKEMNHDLEKIRDKVNVSNSTLQQAIGGMQMQIKDIQEKMKKEMRDILDEGGQSNTRSLADMDARLLALNSKINNLDDNMLSKIQSAIRQIEINPESAELRKQSEELSRYIRDKMAAISLWQDMTQQTLKDVQSQALKSSQESHALKEKHALLQAELDSRVRTEAEVRMNEITELQALIDELKKRPSGPIAGGARREEIEGLQQSVRKLAESIQTVKTVLGMKITSEQKLRFEEIESLQDDVVRLRGLIEPLLKRKPHARVFIKPDNADQQTRWESEVGQPSINMWSIYSANRWLKIKSKWMYVKWKKDSASEGGKSNDTPVDGVKDIDSKSNAPYTENKDDEDKKKKDEEQKNDEKDGEDDKNSDGKANSDKNDKNNKSDEDKNNKSDEDKNDKSEEDDKGVAQPENKNQDGAEQKGDDNKANSSQGKNGSGNI